MPERSSSRLGANPSRILQPKGWTKPIGYSNGIEARGRIIFVSGQIGWNAECRFEAHELTGQVQQTLENIIAILAEAGAGPEHVTSMTWYLLDKRDYLKKSKEIGMAYRQTMGRHFPAMAIVQVSALVEDDALVEIQAMAVIPD